MALRPAPGKATYPAGSESSRLGALPVGPGFPLREEAPMPKVLRCGDLMPGCKAVVEGKDVNEVMSKAAEHAKKDHGMATIPPDVAAKVKAAIKDE